MNPLEHIQQWFKLLKDRPAIDYDDPEPDNYEPDEDVGDNSRER